MLILLLISALFTLFRIQLIRAEPKSIRVFPNYTLDPEADFTRPPSPGYYDTSEYLMGSVAVGIILPESMGGTYNWTEVEINQTVTGIKKAMDWWASQEPDANLSFLYDLHIQVPTTYEPIEMHIGEDFIWIDDVMSQLNYTSGSAWEKVRAYNNNIRELLGTDWAFTIFVVDSNPHVNLGLFKGGGYAHAFFGGPWVTMSRYSPWAWNSINYHVAVPAHEMGHIFYATDEYNYVREYSGYLNASDNDGAYGIMNRNSFFVSASTKLQVGWRDTDDDGIMDILDTFPEIALDLDPSMMNETSYLFSGAVVEIPYPNKNPYGPGNNVTINKIISVKFSVDDEPWKNASPIDGSFDEALENFTFTLTSLTSGKHSLKIRAINSVGNVRERDFTVEIPPISFVSATIEIEPNALNVASRGKWITAYIELPANYNIIEIDVSSILLNGTIPVDLNAPVAIGDYNSDDVPDLMIKFNRTAVKMFLQRASLKNKFTNVTLIVTGSLKNGQQFQASDTLKRIKYPSQRIKTSVLWKHETSYLLSMKET